MDETRLAAHLIGLRTVVAFLLARDDTRLPKSGLKTLHQALVDELAEGCSAVDDSGLLGEHVARVYDQIFSTADAMRSRMGRDTGA